MSDFSHNEEISQTKIKVNGIETDSVTKTTHTWAGGVDGDLTNCEFRLTDKVLKIDSEEYRNVYITLNDSIVTVLEHIARLYREAERNETT